MNKKRDYAKEYRDYQGKPEQKKKRAMRNKANRIMKAKNGGTLGRDVHHKDHNPMNNSPSNLSLVSKSVNRADNLGRGGRKPKRLQR